MRYRILLVLVAFAAPASGVHAADLAAGLTEALVVGTRQVVDKLGRSDGFLNDPRA